jgi:4-carboxymuconolactone decarboxylase
MRRGLACLMPLLLLLAAPIQAQTGPRYAPVDPAKLPPDLALVYQNSVKMLGGPYGPRMPMFQSPDVAREWAKLLDAVSASTLSKRYFELSILAVARVRNSPFEWWAHAANAVKLGVPAAEVEALRLGRPPRFSDPADAKIYRYASALVSNGPVPAPVFKEAAAVLGDANQLNITILIGYYDTVAMVLKSYDMDIPPKSSTTPALVVAR